MATDMIKALGEEEYKDILDKFPEYSDNSWRGNYKPVAMMIMWIEYKEGVAINHSSVRAIIELAYNNWFAGKTLEDSCKEAIMSKNFPHKGVRG